MRNCDKYSLEEILNLKQNDTTPAIVNGKLAKCGEINCKDCDFYRDAVKGHRSCISQFVEWLYSEIPEDVNKNDLVNHLSHYADRKIDVIDYIEDKGLGFCLGNAIKYISRAGKKEQSKEVENLLKAIWYISRRIEQISKEKNNE